MRDRAREGYGHGHGRDTGHGFGSGHGEGGCDDLGCGFGDGEGDGGDSGRADGRGCGRAGGWSDSYRWGEDGLSYWSGLSKFAMVGERVFVAGESIKEVAFIKQRKYYFTREEAEAALAVRLLGDDD
jgi:hypothetical protein